MRENLPPLTAHRRKCTGRNAGNASNRGLLGAFKGVIFDPVAKPVTGDTRMLRRPGNVSVAICERLCDEVAFSVGELAIR